MPKVPKIVGYWQGLATISELDTQKIAASATVNAAWASCNHACETGSYSGDAASVKAQKIACYEKCKNIYSPQLTVIEKPFLDAEQTVRDSLKNFQFDEVVILPKGRTFLDIAKRVYPQAQKYLQVGDKTDLVEALSSDWLVQNLRLFVESGYGSFFLGKSPNLVQVSMAEVTSALKVNPRRMGALTVDMNSCNGASGHGLTALLDLTAQLDSGRDGVYLAWNKFHFFEFITVSLPSANLPPAERIKRLEEKLDFTVGYRVDGEPGPGELAMSKKRKERILVQWFSEDHTQEFRTLPLLRSLQTQKDYQRIGEAASVPIKGRGPAKKYEQVYDSAPIHPNLDHVELKAEIFE